MVHNSFCFDVHQFPPKSTRHFDTSQATVPLWCQLGNEKLERKIALLPSALPKKIHSMTANGFQRLWSPLNFTWLFPPIRPLKVPVPNNAEHVNAHHAFYPLQTEVLEDSQIHPSCTRKWNTQRLNMAHLKKTCTHLQYRGLNDSVTVDVRTRAHLSQLEATFRNGCPGASRYLSLPEALSFLLAAVLWRRNFKVSSPCFGVSSSRKIEHIFGFLGSASLIDFQHDHERGTKINIKVCIMITCNHDPSFSKKGTWHSCQNSALLQVMVLQDFTRHIWRRNWVRSMPSILTFSRTQSQSTGHEAQKYLPERPTLLAKHPVPVKTARDFCWFPINIELQRNRLNPRSQALASWPLNSWHLVIPQVTIEPMDRHPFRAPTTTLKMTKPCLVAMSNFHDYQTWKHQTTQKRCLWICISKLRLGSFRVSTNLIFPKHCQPSSSTKLSHPTAQKRSSGIRTGCTPVAGKREPLQVRLWDFVLGRMVSA